MSFRSGLSAARREARAARLSLALLLGRRLVLFAVLDVVVLLWSFLRMLLDSALMVAALWPAAVLFPLLVLGLPALAGVVDVERRAGCLDLALAAPAAEAYFLRRTGAVCGVMTFQGWAVLLAGWVFDDRRPPLLVLFLHVPLVCFFVGAVALFWAVRLRTAGTVWLASLVTVGLAARWFFANPVPDRHSAVYGAFLPGSEEAFAWFQNAAVLAMATVLLTLYARRRLRRPELMIS